MTIGQLALVITFLVQSHSNSSNSGCFFASSIIGPLTEKPIALLLPLSETYPFRTPPKWCSV
ncbi:MAG: hypothetical protein ACUVXA_13080, partial [Candidatus Jordarchaeum sp.]|uniref:hypothetical protein n=1 Tax=Candidatus Jordarchaeum sp. TaxID=2823881 RepID=UPI00404ADD80